jgi:hypothetical protein
MGAPAPTPGQLGIFRATHRSISCVSRPIAPGHNTGVPIKQRYESMRVSNAVEAAREIERVIAG